MDKVNEVAATLAAGREPSAEALGEALAQAIEDRDAYKGMAEDLVRWFGHVLKAHFEDDATALKSTLDAFVAERVKVVQAQNGNVH